MSFWRNSGCGLALAALMSGCPKETPPAAPPPPPEVTVSQVVERQVIDHADFTGRTDADQKVEIRARVRGYLKEIRFTDGDEVKAGDVLFQIDPRPFEYAVQNAEGQKKQWEAKKMRAQADVERYERLVPTGAATPQDLEKAKADRDEATAAIQSAEAQIETAKLDVEFACIKAPVAGQIGRSLVNKGNLIQGSGAVDELLATIISVDPTYVYFDVDQRLLLRFRDRARASYPPTTTQPDVRDLKIPVFVGLATEQGYPHQGVIDFADNEVDPVTGTIRVRARYDNSKRVFKAGLFVRVQVPMSDPYSALLVSERAIGTEQGEKFVLTVNDQKVVEQRFVKLGSLEPGGLRVITQGLKPGEWVVVNGLQRARPGKPVSAQRGEMPKHAGEVPNPAPVTTQTAHAAGTTAQASH